VAGQKNDETELMDVTHEGFLCLETNSHVMTITRNYYETKLKREFKMHGVGAGFNRDIGC